MVQLPTEEKNVLRSILGFLDDFEEGLVLYNRKDNKIDYINKAAKGMLDTGEDNFNWSVFDEDEIDKLYADGFISKYINGHTVRFSIERDDEEEVWIRLTGADKLNRYEKSVVEAIELNKSLRKTLMEYDQSSLMISDGDGIIVFAGQETVENCGHDKKWYLGKSVYELEKQRTFYPSVIKKVLETGTEQVLIQKTKLSNSMLVAVGVPNFDDDGNITQVISLTKDFSSQIDLSSTIAGMEFSMDITNDDKEPLNHIIGCNDKMMEIKRLIKFIAPTSSTVLILGGTGTGKEVMARAIHNLSDRKDKPFVVVSCGSLSPNIVESELFGYEGGSFTGANKEGKRGLLEAADGGTVFLDEIGELPLNQQVKLLHVLQEKTIVRVGGTKEIPLDIRVVAATNRDLREEIECGNFREDLYYRLNVVSIEIPGLCDRRDDIPLLVKYFAKKFNVKHNKNKVISRKVMKLLCEYDWPGNIRQLENLIENLIVTTQTNYIDTESLPDNIRKSAGMSDKKVIVREIAPLAEIVESAERQLLEMAKQKYITTSAIAEILEVNQSTISRKLTGHGIK